jgi:RNA polymerase sigma-70 factor (ECF subfamily)
VRLALVCCMLVTMSLGGSSLAVVDRDDVLDVARAREGDPAAFESLVRRHEGQVYRLARRMLGDADEALDAAQETFLRVYRGLKDFRGEARLRTWIIGIALNVCRSHLSSSARHQRSRNVPIEQDDPASGVIYARPILDPHPDPEAAAMESELRAALERALAGLSREHREILLMREMQGMDYEELALVCGCPVGTVKSRLCRARQALREAMREIWP